MTLLRPADLAAMLQVTTAHVYRLARQRRVPHLKVGGSLRFDPAAIAFWLKRQEVASVGQVLGAKARSR
jgi:excisionase family DNA binding protein